VAGSQPNEHCRESGISREHIVDGRRSGPGKPFIFDGMAVEAVLVPRKRLGFTRVLAGRDRERQRCSLPTLLTVENTVAMGAPPGSDARSCSEMSKDCEQRSRSSAGAVMRTPTWGRVAARQHGADVARALRSTLRSGPQRRAGSVSARRKPHARESNDPRVHVL